VARPGWRRGSILLAGIAATSLCLNVLLLLRPEPSERLDAAALAGNTPAEAENERVLAVLYQLEERVEATRADVQALTFALMAEPVQTASIDEPSEEVEAAREGRAERRRELLMLDVPEEERAVRLHEAWLARNQDGLRAAAEELERLRALP